LYRPSTGLVILLSVIDCLIMIIMMDNNNKQVTMILTPAVSVISVETLPTMTAV